MKKLYKSTKNNVICGVCGGIAEYFDIDVTIVRLAFVVLGLTADIGLILYIIAALVLKNEPADLVEEF